MLIREASDLELVLGRLRVGSVGIGCADLEGVLAALQMLEALRRGAGLELRLRLLPLLRTAEGALEARDETGRGELELRRALLPVDLLLRDQRAVRRCPRRHRIEGQPGIVAAPLAGGVIDRG